MDKEIKTQIQEVFLDIEKLKVKATRSLYDLGCVITSLKYKTRELEELKEKAFKVELDKNTPDLPGI